MVGQTQRLTVLAGKLFCLSSGVYSDYGYSGHFLALVTITPEMFAKVVDECKAGTERRYEEQDKFIATLIRRGWVMDIDCLEIHIGDYGELDLS